MDYKKLKTYWLTEENRSFQGWDFSSIQGRSHEEALPWSYRDLVLENKKDQDILLDMGTGGGEFLLTLNHPFENTYITEAYEPNYQLCLKTLAPKGIHVHKVSEDGILPFESNLFDMTINRHEDFNLKEVHRVLKPGGIFITQQVGHEDILSLSRLVLNTTYTNSDIDQMEAYLKKANQLGFECLLKDHAYPTIKFYEVGALVYFAKIIQWQFPGFSVDKHYQSLCRIHDHIQKHGSIKNKQDRFILIFKKPE